MPKIAAPRCRAHVSINLLAGLCWLASIQSAFATTPVNQLIVYPDAGGMPRNDDFTVKVRARGQEWQDIPAYAVMVAQGVDTRVPTQRVQKTEMMQESLQGKPKISMSPVTSSIASFDFAGSVDVSITYNKGEIESTRIRPLSYGIVPSVAAKTITFSLSQPRNISIEINGDIFHNLQLLADPIETTKPNPTDPNVIYYGPGIHEIGRLAVPSGKTVYLAGGALVEGAFLINHAENVRILGRGILYQADSAPGPGRFNPPPSRDGNQLPGSTLPLSAASQPIRSERRDAILIEYSKHVEVDGIIEVPNSYSVLIGQSEDVTIKDIKSFSAGGNNDGIDIFTSSNILIDGVFMRNSDDNIAIYGHRWNYFGDTWNVTVQNATLWADVAHPILIGTHGDSDHPDTLEDLKFLNLDILDQREPQLDYQGCMSINSGDGNLIRDVQFENIRVEDIRMGQLVNLRVFFNKKYNTSPGRGIEKVLFKDITYNGTHANPSMIAGYDDTREIKNVVFENLKINGRVISDDMPGKPGYFKTGDMAAIFVGEHVNGVVFRASPLTPLDLHRPTH